jgi:hypothetical protein
MGGDPPTDGRTFSHFFLFIYCIVKKSHIKQKSQIKLYGMNSIKEHLLLPVAAIVT